MAILLVSVLTLLLELLIIRWLGTEVRLFAYLQSTILVVCFLGLGMGCFSSQQPSSLLRVLLPLLGLSALICLPGLAPITASISDLLAPIAGGQLGWGEAGARTPWETDLRIAAGLALAFGLMTLVFLTFVPLGRLLGSLLARHPRPLAAYSIDVAGSLLGTWLMVALSALWLPPAVWFVVVLLLAAPFVAPRGKARVAEVAAMLGLVLLPAMRGEPPGTLETMWSPYQKLTLHREATARPGDHVIWVNGTGYQGIIDLSDAQVARHPDAFPEELRGYGQYDLPARLRPGARRTLVVGSGAGNDVAGALRRGAAGVTAVDVDPAIVEFGRRLHPERPYAGDVRVVIDDARAFFTRTDERYDLIVFGLLDAHSTPSLANARLDHYVYTRESLARARSLLTEDGVMVLSFAAVHRFIAERISRTLTEVFGERPITFAIPPGPSGWGGVMFVTGDLAGVRARLAADPRLLQATRRNPLVLDHDTAPSTDDWPYLYLERPSVPAAHLLFAGLLALLFFLGGRLSGCPTVLAGWDRSRAHFFFLGAAFMLLEVVSIGRASVALGSTWWVSAVVITGVLVMVLVSNAYVLRRPHGAPGPVFALLLAACAFGIVFDLSWLGSLPYPARAALAGAVVTLPMLFSGVAFARAFAAAPARDLALGANLFGALAGGVLQSLSLLVGQRALLVVVACLYALAWACAPRRPPAGSTP